jgi:hypothetical protein
MPRFEGCLSTLMSHAGVGREEDRAEIEVATEAVEKADRLRGAYEAAAACFDWPLVTQPPALVLAHSAV